LKSPGAPLKKPATIADPGVSGRFEPAQKAHITAVPQPLTANDSKTPGSRFSWVIFFDHTLLARSTLIGMSPYAQTHQGHGSFKLSASFVQPGAPVANTTTSAVKVSHETVVSSTELGVGTGLTGGGGISAPRSTKTVNAPYTRSAIKLRM
jgi:hypothetical protein